MTKHIKILGKGNHKLLGDTEYIEIFINSTIKKLDMEPLGKAKIYDVPIEIEKLGREPFEDEGGITSQLVGFSTLSTSHIAIHTWPLRNEFHLDIYSCRDFDKDIIVYFIIDTFSTTDIKVSDLTKYCDWD